MKPCPSSPRQLVIGTRTSLKNSSDVSASSCPILSRLRPRWKPSRSASTSTIDTPFHAGSTSVSVLTQTRIRSAFWPLVMKVFDPLMTRSEEHTSELQSLMRISYAVFCLKKKKTNQNRNYHNINQ